MSTHTPGPWNLQQYTKFLGFSIWAEGCGCIAERWYDTNQAEPYGSEIEANARLIAAAPDLYEALKSIENDDGHIPAAIWKLRNNAIAKVEKST